MSHLCTTTTSKVNTDTFVTIKVLSQTKLIFCINILLSCYGVPIGVKKDKMCNNDDRL